MPSDDEKSVVGSDAADENSDSDRGSGEEVYEVEKILKRRVVRNKNEYLVRWRGYTPSADTWEPEANLGGAKEAMKKFLETEDGKGGGSAKGKKRSSGGGGIGSSSSASKSKKNSTGAGSSKRMFDDEAAAADDSSGVEEGSDDDDFQPAKKLKKESDPAKRGRPAAANKKKKAGGGKGAARKASPSGGSRSTVTPVPKPNFDSPLAKALKTRTQLGINQRKLDWLNSDDSDNSNSKRDDSIDKVPPKEQKDKQEKMNGDLVQKVNAVKENSVGTVAGSPPPPVDPVGNNSRKDEDFFSDHDEVDNKMAHMPGSGEKVNGLAKSDDNLSTAETARMNGTSSSASFRASTSTPVANNSGGSRKNEKASNSNSKAKVKTVEEQEDDEAEEKEEEEEEQGPRSTRRQPRHVAQTNNKKGCPQKLHINAMFRDGKGQLMMMANQGTSVGVTTTINGALERKLVLLLKEELKNGLDD